jgi:predicted RNA methylase
VRRLSATHWTPVEVALQAADLLAPTQQMRVLDIGSGVGKPCCIGALATGATWCGIERDSRRVEVALDCAHTLDVLDRVSFLCGEMTSLDWGEFDGIYLFNPFEAELFDTSRLDPDVAYARFAECVLETERRLSALRPGTRVVTYHGFGGTMPASFEMSAREPSGTDQLVLWTQQSTTTRSRWWAAA